LKKNGEREKGGKKKEKEKRKKREKETKNDHASRLLHSSPPVLSVPGFPPETASDEIPVAVSLGGSRFWRDVTQVGTRYRILNIS